MKFDEMLYGMTTIINTNLSTRSASGSGFFYNALAARDPSKTGAQWRNIEGTWLVTNRHVALYKINDTEYLPDNFIFNLRQIINDTVEWLPVTLTKDELRKRLKVHPNKDIDVAVIDVANLIIEKAKAGIPLMNFAGLTSDHLPDNSPLTINTGDDILVAGYPRSYYDRANKFPIVKSGIISTKWGANFDGNPYFLIDSKLFPGSSGSIVLTKPQYVAVINGNLKYNAEGQYIFLGIYSGEPMRVNRPIELEDMTIIKKDSYNEGIVWYSSLVPEIISNGVNFPNI